jgi:hypothetical protein
MVSTTLNRACRVLFGGAAVAGCLVATALAQNDDIHGTWSCGLSIQDPATGTTMNADFEQTYAADGTYERDGEMNILIEAFEVDITIVIEESGTWRWVEPMVLGETTSEIAFSSPAETPSQMEQMMLTQMQAAADAEVSQEQTVEIRSITATALELVDDEGAEMACDKA